MALAVLADSNAAVSWLRAAGTRALCTDSRRVGSGDAFLAWPGARDDGRRHVAAALAAGARACATIWRRNSRSGGTLSSRSVCCTTELNTGAATSPPKWPPMLG